jgi:hypothetical protein
MAIAQGAVAKPIATRLATSQMLTIGYNQSKLEEILV